jgi:predicted enzyme related to lactoylglutathione lyase
MAENGRAVGTGGVFFKAKGPDSLAKCYVEMLGLPQDPESGVSFASRDETPGARTVFATFESESEYFGRFAWIADPEGNRVELWEPRE